MKHKRLKQSLIAGLMASLFFTGMQAQEPEPVQLRDTTYTDRGTNCKAIYCTLSDGTELFFNSSGKDMEWALYTAPFYLELYRIDSDQPALSIPGDYVYRGYRFPLKKVWIENRNSTTNRYNCDFQEITVPEGTEVFCLEKASALTTLNLPSTLVHLDFTFSDDFKDLYLHSVYPPFWGEVIKNQMTPMSQPLTDVTIHVPAMAMDFYSRSEQYNGGSLVAMEEPVGHLFAGWQPDMDLTIHKTEGLADNALLTIPTWYASSDWGLTHILEAADAQTKSEGDLYPARLTMDADRPVKLQKFRLEQDCGEYKYGKYQIAPSTAIFKSPVTAGEIEMTYHMFHTKLRWKGKEISSSELGNNSRSYLVSFPFDVKISDIAFPALQDTSKMEVICMEYEGGKRATVTGTSYWRRLSNDEVLHANRGYLIDFFGMSHTNVQGTHREKETTLHVRAMDTENKQMIFTNDDVAVPLTAHPSEHKHREGWNLIGNPYPCFFDIRHLDFTAPITVFDGFTFYAVSPLDDDYCLYPNEAFFLQCPEGVSSVTFKKEGRLHNDPEGLWLLNAPQSKRPSAHQAPGSGDVRRVYNFLLDGEEGFDRARVVINEQASAGYELEHDAAKMTGQGGPQLYVQDGGVQYAIDERPLADGCFGLGMVFPAKGSYVLSLKDNPDSQMAVMLTDRLTGAETDLTETAYTFDAAAGTAADRFSVRIRAKMPTPVQDISDHSGESVYYDLQGRIVTDPAMMQKGVYILRQGQTTRKIVK